MIVKLVGLKPNVKYIGKDNQEHVKNLAFVTYKQEGVIGLAIESLWLDVQGFPADSLTVGSDYVLERNRRGYLAEFYPAS